MYIQWEFPTDYYTVVLLFYNYDWITLKILLQIIVLINIIFATLH